MVAASGWPYNILAGSDLNGDGDGGAFPSDRARRDPLDPATSLNRNAGRLPSQATVDLRVSRPLNAGGVRIEPRFDLLNVFNRINFTDVQNVFGGGRYPSQPAPAYGQFTQAGSARQAQIGLTVSF
jgi:hypothetical protein